MRVIEETPGYWRAVFDYPPFNVVDGDVFQAVQDLLVRMETTESLRVVVFESALPDFYLSHFDLTGRLGNVMSAIGPTGLPILMDTFVRLTKAPVVSLARIRRCPRTPDRRLRSARSRCGKTSRQPSLFAAVRSAPRRLRFVWHSTRVARSSEPYKHRARARTATRRRLREKLARNPRLAR